jgi:hypothetical protein
LVMRFREPTVEFVPAGGGRNPEAKPAKSGGTTHV